MMVEDENRPSSTMTIVHAVKKEKAYSFFIGMLIGFRIGLLLLIVVQKK